MRRTPACYAAHGDPSPRSLPSLGSPGPPLLPGLLRIPRSVGPPFAPAGAGVGRPVCASGVMFFKDARSRLRLDQLFGVADDRSGLPERGGHSINECPAVGSRSNATASGPAERSGKCRLPGISLRSTRLTLPALRPSTRTAPRPGSRHRDRSSPHASRPAPRGGVFWNALRLVFSAVGPCWLAPAASGRLG